VKQDYKEAVEWYRKAAEQGYAKAQSSLGLLYTNGKGVQLDHKEAVAWFRKAAEQGRAVTQFNLGFMSANSQGVKHDFAVATNLWQPGSSARRRRFARSPRRDAATQRHPNTTARHRRHCHLADLCGWLQAQQQPSFKMDGALV